MFVSCVYMLCCPVQVDLCEDWSLVQSCTVCLILCDLKKPQRRRPRPDLGCRATGWMDISECCLWTCFLSKVCMQHLPTEKSLFSFFENLFLDIRPRVGAGKLKRLHTYRYSIIQQYPQCNCQNQTAYSNEKKVAVYQLSIITLKINRIHARVQRTKLTSVPSTLNPPVITHYREQTGKKSFSCT
jgi:hypothetical protein